MLERSQAFVALPGGFGTLEEMLEVKTLKQLHEHQHPIIYFNVNGFWNELFAVFERFYAEDFAKADYRALYVEKCSVFSVVEYLKSYSPPALPEKWYPSPKKVIM